MHALYTKSADPINFAFSPSMCARAPLCERESGCVCNKWVCVKEISFKANGVVEAFLNSTRGEVVFSYCTYFSVGRGGLPPTKDSLSRKRIVCIYV